MTEFHPMEIADWDKFHEAALTLAATVASEGGRRELAPFITTDQAEALALMLEALSAEEEAAELRREHVEARDPWDGVHVAVRDGDDAERWRFTRRPVREHA